MSRDEDSERWVWGLVWIPIVNSLVVQLPICVFYWWLWGEGGKLVLLQSYMETLVSP